MFELKLIAILLFVFIGLPIGVACLLYFVPKRLGYPKTGKYLTIGFSLIVLFVVVFTVFEDDFFTRNDAKKLVEEQGIVLVDKFSLKDNKSIIAIGDYYHTFTLTISDLDKQHAIDKIKHAANFTTAKDSIDNTLYLNRSHYLGPTITQNYETESEFITEYFKPSGKQGYAPTFRRIAISKNKSELRFEDID